MNAREVLDRLHLAVTDHHVGLAAHDRGHQQGHVGAVVLVVGVGVDDHVGAELEPGVEAGLEGGGQTLVVGQADDVVDAVAAGHVDRRVGRAVVDDQPLDHVEAGDLTGQPSQRGGQLGFLVVTGDLDDELHQGANGARQDRSAISGQSRALRLIMPVTHGSGILAQEMNVAILSDPAPEAPQLPDPGAPRGRRRLPERIGRHVREHGLYGPALALLLAGAFLLRVWGIKQGLPYSYNSDEQAHFVPRAIAFFWHDLNPHYFLNPPAYSYLLHIVFELWFGSGDAVARDLHDRSEHGVRGRAAGGRGARDGGGRLHLPGRSPAVQSRDRAARRRDHGRGLPARLLQPPRAQRRAHAGARRAGALRRRRGHAPWAPARLRARRSGDRAGRGDQVHRRGRARVPARRRDRGRLRRLAGPERAPLRCSPSPSRCWRSSSPTRTRC